MVFIKKPRIFGAFLWRCFLLSLGCFFIIAGFAVIFFLVAENGLERADLEGGAFLATDGDSDGADSHGALRAGNIDMPSKRGN
jgi:hypothetical protein